MKKTIPVLRTIGLGCAMMIAGAVAAAAAEPAKAEADWVRRGLYFGPAIGVADADGVDFGWSLHTLFRPVRYGGIQVEYFNLGPDADSDGDRDGLYIGAMPIVPLQDGVSLFGQVGCSFASGDEDVTAGGGILYDIPLDPVKKYLPGGFTLRGDYKYFDFGDAAHLATVGVMIRFGPLGK